MEVKPRGFREECWRNSNGIIKAVPIEKKKKRKRKKDGKKQDDCFSYICFENIYEIRRKKIEMSGVEESACSLVRNKSKNISGS